MCTRDHRLLITHSLLAFLFGFLGAGCIEGKPVCNSGSCGAQAACATGGSGCVCESGWRDCNGDLGRSGGNGCECNRSCAGGVCGGCSVSQANSCGSQQQYCSSTTSSCQACPGSSFNCDGVNVNLCESSVPCGAPVCNPAVVGACPDQGSYCNVSLCTPCASGRYDCDALGSNGCERGAPCSASSCVAATPGSCSDDAFYCDASGACRACPAGWLNCDLRNSNACEEQASSCSAFVCDPKQRNACPGNTRFCDATLQRCDACPIGRYNCDGIDSCERSNGCVQASCDDDCLDQSDHLCIEDTSGVCVECLEDGHCAVNTRSRGPRCDAKRCVCDGNSDCVGRSSGTLCLNSLGACGCENISDCPTSPYDFCVNETRRCANL